MTLESNRTSTGKLSEEYVSTVDLYSISISVYINKPIMNQLTLSSVG